MQKLELHDNVKFANFGFQENGHHYWLGSWFANVLSYKSLKTLRPTISAAIRLCLYLNIPVEDNFIKIAEGRKIDYKLTKFACFLISLQADSRKEVVRKARGYFLKELEDLNVLLSDQDYLDRMIGREKLKGLNKKLNSLAKRSHVRDFQYFINEGYLGLYHKTSKELKAYKKLAPDKDMADYMNTTELLANMMRIQLTSEKLKKLRNPSEIISSKKHRFVGEQIRILIKKTTGCYPEDISLNADIRKLQSQLYDIQELFNHPENRLTT